MKHDIFHNELQMSFSLGREGTASSHQNFYESIFFITDKTILPLKQKFFLSFKKFELLTSMKKLIWMFSGLLCLKIKCRVCFQKSSTIREKTCNFVGLCNKAEILRAKRKSISVSGRVLEGNMASGNW